MKSSKPAAEFSEVRAQAFTLTDSEGNDRARLRTAQDGTARIELLNPQGQVRLSLVADDVESSLTIYSDGESWEPEKGSTFDREQVIERLKLGYWPHSAGSHRRRNVACAPEILLRDGQGSERLRARVLRSGEPLLAVNGLDKSQHCVLKPRGLMICRDGEQSLQAYFQTPSEKSLLAKYEAYFARIGQGKAQVA